MPFISLLWHVYTKSRTFLLFFHVSQPLDPSTLVYHIYTKNNLLEGGVENISDTKSFVGKYIYTKINCTRIIMRNKVGGYMKGVDWSSSRKILRQITQCLGICCNSV